MANQHASVAAEELSPGRMRSFVLTDLAVQLGVTLNRRSMYPSGHPSLRMALDDLLRRLPELLADRQSLVIVAAPRQLIVDGFEIEGNDAVFRRLTDAFHALQCGAIILILWARRGRAYEVLGMLTAESLYDKIRETGQRPNLRWPHITLRSWSFDGLALKEEVSQESGTDGGPEDSQVDLWLALSQTALSNTQSSDFQVASAVPGAVALVRRCSSSWGRLRYGRVLSFLDSTWEGDSMIARGIMASVAVALGLGVVGPVVRAQTVTVEAADGDMPLRAMLDQYCVACHNDRTRQAGLTLQAINTDQIGQVEGEIEVWEKVSRKLRARAMPPPGRPRPEDVTYEAVASRLEMALDRSAAAHPNPGQPPIHRLNRAEYRNAIRDLLGLEVDERELLPPDESGYGFDNIADILAVSPVLLDRYMVAAEKISRLALGDASIRPVVEKHTIPYTLWQEGRMSEKLPFGSRGGAAFRHHFPLDGEYVIKLMLQRAYGNHIRGLGEVNDIELRLDRKRLAQFTVGGDGERAAWNAVSRPTLYEQTADDGLEIRISVKAGTRLVSAAFLDQAAVAEGVLEPRPGVSSLAYSRDRNAAMALESINISGPYNARTPEDTPSRRRVFVCYPNGASEEEACATEILSTLARRAFRRPVGTDDVEPLVALYREGHDVGGFEGGVQFALRGILIDPEFLFRVERDPIGTAAGAVFRLSDLELASRLSFFLWSSLPDDELLDVVARGVLSEPAVLEQQIARMMRDPRSDALIENFFGQWLLLRNIRTAAPDPEAFLDFDENLRNAMERETALFVQSQVRDDQSVLDLLLADYSFLNERLARHYGVLGVYGNHFRRVPLDRSERRGLLGQGSILTVTSYPNRTSPTKRGLWVLENLLGAPPPPPPPEVPGLPDAEHPDDARVMSMRERMEAHRTSPVCASCHQQMDPLGFSLENFDGVGAWRVTEGDTAIDASTKLPNGVTFVGASGLRDVLLGRKERFVETLTEKLLTYALGRGVEYYDAPAVRAVTRQAAAQDYRWSALIQGIVESTPFQMRRSREP